MKRIQEKVKDIVEVRSYESLQDFISNPAQTVAIYHFTDATSELMAKWLDAITNVSFESGAACALAGYRGVGKSHFLATLGAIVSHPELRSRITDAHVSAGAQHLKRRRHPVAFVRRGIYPTLLEELKVAVAKVFEIQPLELTDSVAEILDFCARKAGDLPFVLMIDTAFERSLRVLRDDGVLLGEIAEIAKNLNIFVGVALDDDIAGADGVNSAIARSFKIDYLDQDHLYRVVDTHIFPKHRQMTPVLHDIYTYFRAVLPSFRWSEQRFSALYPLHPIILEIAPFVRLYAPEFALLGFTSDAGKKILGRPANSLIGLDEVFDIVEATLRKVDDLQDSFAAYDKINSEVVSQIPIMQRLQAKLILKALLLLSLEGDGTTASEVGAAMLIFDENEPLKAVRNVGDLIETFASALPEQIQRTVEEGREIRYGFTVSSKENLNRALAEAALSLSPEVVPTILRRIAREKFSDWTISDETDANSADWMECQINWRGGLRRGRISWDLEKPTGKIESAAHSELVVWELFINRQEGISVPIADTNETPKIYWSPADLKKDELDTILRYYALLTRTDLHEEYGEQIRAAGHTQTLAVEKIWKRIFLQDGKLVIDGFDYNFSEEARSAQTLSEMLSLMLEPLFETRFPSHPYFARTLGMGEVSALTGDFFSGARQNLEQSQRLAETFALPLGLVARRGDLFALETEENLLNLPLAQEILALVKLGGEETVSLKNIYRQLKKSPNGLVREAQHLILTALVAQRQIEFVTSKGDRINRRSLDLKIIWDDIEGIAKPVSVIYSSARLTNWAKTLTGTEDFQSIENPKDHEPIKLALQNWLNDWQTARVLERFGELPDEILNTKVWRLAVHAEKTFGSVAEIVKSILNNLYSLDEGLHRIADAFLDSEEEFCTVTLNLVLMEDFISGSAKRQEIWSYLAVCEPTQHEKVEYFREKLLQIIDESAINPSESLNREMENVWESFRLAFSEHFAVNHDLVMKSHHLHEKFDEIRQTNEWWEFESLSRLPIFRQVHWQEAQKICRQFKQLDCRYDVREMLNTHPFCACTFNLAQIKDWEKLPQVLWETINKARISYRRNLLMLRETILPIIEIVSTQNAELFEAGEHLAQILKEAKEFPILNDFELIVLQKTFASLPTSPLLSLKLPSAETYMTREELRVKMNKWMDELPSEPVLVKV